MSLVESPAAASDGLSQLSNLIIGLLTQGRIGNSPRRRLSSKQHPTKTALTLFKDGAGEILSLRGSPEPTKGMNTLFNHDIHQRKEMKTQVFRTNQPADQHLKMVTLNLTELTRNKNTDNDNIDEILQSLREQEITGLLSIEQTNMRMRLTFDSAETSKNLTRDGLSLTSNKKIKIFSEHKPEFVLTACGIPGFYENRDISKVFSNFGEVERVKKVIRTTKSGIEYTNGNRVIIFTSFNQKPPKKIYIDSHRITLVFSTIPAHYFPAQENSEQIVSNNIDKNNNESESISGESIRSLDLFAETETANPETETQITQVIPETPIELSLSPAVIKIQKPTSKHQSDIKSDNKEITRRKTNEIKAKEKRINNVNSKRKLKPEDLAKTSRLTSSIEVEMTNRTASSPCHDWGDSQEIESPTPTPSETIFQNFGNFQHYALTLNPNKIQEDVPTITINKDGTLKNLGKMSWIWQCNDTEVWFSFIGTALAVAAHKMNIPYNKIQLPKRYEKEIQNHMLKCQCSMPNRKQLKDYWDLLVKSTKHRAPELSLIHILTLPTIYSV